MNRFHSNRDLGCELVKYIDMNIDIDINSSCVIFLHDLSKGLSTKLSLGQVVFIDPVHCSYSTVNH